VARPHGILTRFPILPMSWGTQMLSNQKSDVIVADTITRSSALSNPVRATSISRVIAAAALLPEFASSKIHRIFNSERTASTND
jgi:hypothetical protein